MALRRVGVRVAWLLASLLLASLLIFAATNALPGDIAQVILGTNASPGEAERLRAELGLDRGPWAVFADWAGGLLRGDAGSSWISNRPVLPGMLEAMSVSLTLMGFALAVALVVAAAVVAPALRAGLRGAPTRGSGIAAVALTALPEFLLASVVLVVGSVWLGLFPPYGWSGPQYAVLPALALGLPAGGLIGRLMADAVTATFSEKWITTWRLAGFGDSPTPLTSSTSRTARANAACMKRK